jgi:hypothetical protein
MESYSLKKRKATSYAEVNLLHLPKPMKRKREAKLYPVLVIEEDKENGRVKVHYVGYSTKFDEWKDTDEIEDLPGKDTPGECRNLWLICPWYTVEPNDSPFFAILQIQPVK